MRAAEDPDGPPVPGRGADQRRVELGAEARRFAPGLRCQAVTEHGRARPHAGRSCTARTFVVTSYTLLRLDEDEYGAQPWAAVILDEAQFVKNRQAATYKAARRLRAPFKFAVTGTPMENNLMDLWSLLSIATPGLFPSPDTFTELYRKPIENEGAPDVLARLRRRIAR